MNHKPRSRRTMLYEQRDAASYSELDVEFAAVASASASTSADAAATTTVATTDYRTLVSSTIEESQCARTCLYCNEKKSVFVMACALSEATDTTNDVKARADAGNQIGAHMMCDDCNNSGKQHTKTGKYGKDGARCFFCVKEMDAGKRNKNCVGFPIKRRCVVASLNSIVGVIDKLEDASSKIEADERATAALGEGGGVHIRTVEAERRRAEAAAHSEAEATAAAALSDQQREEMAAQFEAERRRAVALEAEISRREEASRVDSETRRQQEEAEAEERATEAERRAAEAEKMQELEQALARETQEKEKQATLVKQAHATIRASTSTSASAATHSTGKRVRVSVNDDLDDSGDQDDQDDQDDSDSGSDSDGSLGPPLKGKGKAKAKPNGTNGTNGNAKRKRASNPESDGGDGGDGGDSDDEDPELAAAKAAADKAAADKSAKARKKGKNNFETLCDLYGGIPSTASRGYGQGVLPKVIDATTELIEEKKSWQTHYQSLYAAMVEQMQESDPDFDVAAFVASKDLPACDDEDSDGEDDSGDSEP